MKVYHSCSSNRYIDTSKVDNKPFSAMYIRKFIIQKHSHFRIILIN